MPSFNRRTFIRRMAGSAPLLAAPALLSACQPTETPAPDLKLDRPLIPVFIGTYTRGDSNGIYRGLFDPESGALTDIQLAATTVNPSFLTTRVESNLLLAVNEVDDFEGTTSGAITAFRIAEAGTLELVNRQITQGGAPCYVTLDQTGRVALIANYSGGSVAAFPIDPAGRLGAASAFVQHEGSSVHPRRQQRPHAHCIVVDPSNRFAFAADLGMDRIVAYSLDPDTGQMVPQPDLDAIVAPGAGPRHFTFHPEGRHAFVINELNSTITAFTYNPDTGSLVETNTLSTLPGNFSGDNYCADIHVHPNGRWVYGSNRGHDSIVIARFDAAANDLTLLGLEPTQGETPRNFALDPTGNYLLAANQRTDTIVSFRVDPETGLLEPTGHVAEAPTPVCLKFAQV